MWLTPHARGWLRSAADGSHLSQALIIDTLIKFYDLYDIYRTFGRFTPEQRRAWENINALTQKLPKIGSPINHRNTVS